MNKPIELKVTFIRHEREGIRAKVVVTNPGAYPSTKIFEPHKDVKKKVKLLEGEGCLDLTYDFFSTLEEADQWAREIAAEVYRQYGEWYTENCIPPDSQVHVVTPYEGSLDKDELLLKVGYSQVDEGIRATVTCICAGLLPRIRDIFRSLSNTVDVVSGDTGVLVKTYDTAPQAQAWVEGIVAETEAQYRGWYKGTAPELPRDRRVEIRPRGNVKLIVSYRDGEVEQKEKTEEDRPKLTALHIRRYVEAMYGNVVFVHYVSFKGSTACSVEVTISPRKGDLRGMRCQGIIHPNLRDVYRWAFPNDEIDDGVNWEDLVHPIDKVVYRGQME